MRLCPFSVIASFAAQHTPTKGQMAQQFIEAAAVLIPHGSMQRLPAMLQCWVLIASKWGQLHLLQRTAFREWKLKMSNFYLDPSEAGRFSKGDSLWD